MGKSNPDTSVFFVLDFDRTIGNTEKSQEVLESVIENMTAITRDTLQEARATTQQSGASFDTVDYIKQLLTRTHSPVSWYQIEQRFIVEAVGYDMLMPFAARLLSILDEKNIPYGIVTYGNETWQLAKLEAARLLHIPHLVTHILEKGKLMEGWKHHGNTFLVPPALTRDFRPREVSSLVFLDDKAKSFATLPTGVRAIHVQSLTGKVLPSQVGTLPTGVESVKGIEGAISLLFPDEQRN